MLFSPVYIESHPRPFTLSLEGRGSASAFPIDPQQLLFCKHAPPITNLESTLLQVFILKNLKPFEINTYKKQGEGWSLWLTKCSKKSSAANFSWIPTLPFSVPTSKSLIPH